MEASIEPGASGLAGVRPAGTLMLEGISGLVSAPKDGRTSSTPTSKNNNKSLTVIRMFQKSKICLFGRIPVWAVQSVQVSCISAQTASFFRRNEQDCSYHRRSRLRKHSPRLPFSQFAAVKFCHYKKVVLAFKIKVRNEHQKLKKMG